MLVKMVNKIKREYVCVLIGITLSLLILTGTASAKINPTLNGFRVNEGGGGSLNIGWTGGNLGNTWAEGEWVPYMLVLTGVQDTYPNLNGLYINVSYDFTRKEIRYIDLVRGLQAGTTPLIGSQGWPDDTGNALPLTTRGEIEAAQNDIGNLPPLDNNWTGFKLLDLPIDQINIVDGGIETPTDSRHMFVITRADLISAGILEDADTIVIYGQLHESRTLIWNYSLQSGYDAPPAHDWGGYLYNELDFIDDMRLGAGYVPGASGHIHLESIGGSQDVPIPLPAVPPGEVSGIKWEDNNGNGVRDGTEPVIPDWEIYINSTFEGIDFDISMLTDEFGAYALAGLSTGIWTIKEESKAVGGYVQTYPNGYEIVGQGNSVIVNPPPAGAADYGWEVELTLANPYQDNMSFGNMISIPEIKINKTVDKAIIYSGDMVTYTFKVTNPGNVPLTKIVVTDNQPGVTANYQSGDTNDDDLLDMTEIWIYTATANPSADVTNIGNATGDDSLGNPVYDEDTASVNVIDPAINIVKTVDKQIIYSGEQVTYTYTVTNTGDDPLANVQVTDDQPGVTPAYQSGDINDDDLLDLTETWIYTATANPSADVTNIGNATGDDSLGNPVYDEDTAFVEVILLPSLGTGTPGYWINHPEVWDGFGDDDIVYINMSLIGGQPGILIGDWNNNSVCDGDEECLPLTLDDALEYLKPDKGDKTRTLARSLVAAWLNVLAGNEDDCIHGTVNDSVVLFETYTIGSKLKGKDAKEFWETDGGKDLHTTLDQYNNGMLCAPHRDSSDLMLVKTASETNPLAGESLQYIITISNSGPANATDVTITDTLDDNLTFNATLTSDNPWTCSNAGQLVTCTLSGEIPVGNTATLNIGVDVNSSVAFGTVIWNWAEVASQEPEYYERELNNNDSVSITVGT